MEKILVLLPEYPAWVLRQLFGVPIWAQIGALILITWIGWGNLTGLVRYLRLITISEGKFNSFELFLRNIASQVLVWFGFLWMIGTLGFVSFTASVLMGEEGIGISLGALIFAFILALIITASSEYFLVSGKEFKELKKGDPLYDRVANFCERAWIKPPRVFIHLGEMDPNAFFCGLFRGRLVVHEGFLKGGRWTNADLDAVLAHEIGHKFNGDIFLVMLSMTIILAIEFIGRALIRFGEWTIRKSGSGKDGWKVALFGLGVVITGFVFAVLVTFITGLAKMAVMRNRELMADRLGIAMTQDPAGMATLFRKFSECPPAPERLAKSALRSALFIRPVVVGFSKDRLASTFDGVVASHPSNETRYRQAMTLVPGQ